ncbi:DUF2927 domain-containing protein [Lentibacter algarum]|uniref:DUF2927 domain-containing protein n=1 Tax=Lentibacter algarum TaxID=576131 RepID=UPI001C07DFF3|nr:DUF2927 domain-containing protein [Lentibacter algarum]MBU2980802.1 DUF2927 domain-containing protein [Lentibacter algarum]
MFAGKTFRTIGLAFIGLALLAGCDLPMRESLKPQARPADLIKPATAPSAKPKPQSKTSLALSEHYVKLQAHLLAQGLLRRDGGGPDTGFRAADLARNFEAIAFHSEHGASPLISNAGTITRFHRWRGSVRVAAHFGASSDPAQRAKDQAALKTYLPRLSRVSRHAIGSAPESGANFHVLFFGADETEELRKTVQQVWPGFPQSSLNQMTNLPRDIYCLVYSNVSSAAMGAEQAIALIRTEHPDLMRLSCIHEEVAQGLGLSNDSPYARPSIFNDDEEFATLTTHDELLLKMLYDPRLKNGMTLQEARPIIATIAAELTGEVAS